MHEMWVFVSFKIIGSSFPFSVTRHAQSFLFWLYCSFRNSWLCDYTAQKLEGPFIFYLSLSFLSSPPLKKKSTPFSPSHLLFSKLHTLRSHSSFPLPLSVQTCLETLLCLKEYSIQIQLVFLA